MSEFEVTFTLEELLDAMSAAIRWPVEDSPWSEPVWEVRSPNGFTSSPGTAQQAVRTHAMFLLRTHAGERPLEAQT